MLFFGAIVYLRKDGVKPVEMNSIANGSYLGNASSIVADKSFMHLNGASTPGNNTGGARYSTPETAI